MNNKYYLATVLKALGRSSPLLWCAKYPWQLFCKSGIIRFDGTVIGKPVYSDCANILVKDDKRNDYRYGW